MSFATSEFAVGLDHVVAADVATPARRRSWKEVDRALRELARCRAALDADEARLLVIAVRDEVWRKLGRGSLFEYLEEVLGHTPRHARERVRVAKALADMPALEDALATGALHWSAVRELSRVAIPATVDRWLTAARGKNLRQIEELVAGRSKGDAPDDPPNPDACMRHLRVDVTPDTIALMIRVRQQLEDERGEPVDDNTLLAAAFRACLDDRGAASRACLDDDERIAASDTMADASERTSSDARQPRDGGLARFQIMTWLCESCQAAAHEAGGRRYPLDDTSRAIALCDAQWIGSNRAPQRATQDVSPMTRRFVHRRDRGKCTVPSCRATRFIDVHHVVPRSEGGGHDAGNLTLLCEAHHRALHDGSLTITGTAPALEVRLTAHHLELADEPMTHVGHKSASNQSSHLAAITHVGHESARLAREVCEHADMLRDAKLALVTLKFPKVAAHAAVDAAWEKLRADPEVDLEQLIRVSLRSLHDPR